MTNAPSQRQGGPRDYSALLILAVLGLVEVALLYVLIALETPLTPLVQRLLRSPLGVFSLVMWVVSILVVGMWGLTSWAARRHKKRSRVGA